VAGLDIGANLPSFQPFWPATIWPWSGISAVPPGVVNAGWQALVPGARVETIADAGHMLPWEQPEAFADAVARFLG
jgi:pimeloyl-ACP methyl ester carboxylesterase